MKNRSRAPKSSNLRINFNAYIQNIFHILKNSQLKDDHFPMSIKNTFFVLFFIKKNTIEIFNSIDWGNVFRR
jgi:hypothetical protein